VPSASTSESEYGPRRLTVELTNVCNLHCGYCLRDDDHHQPASELPVHLFARIAAEAQAAMGIEQVTFTGGEPTLHRRFGDILAAVERLGLTCSFVSNGWHFAKVWPLVAAHRAAVSHVSFSLDGTTREAHDGWRGRGSFDRVVQAFSRCWADGLPFSVRVGVRRDTAPDLERFAIFAARMGAARLSFAHVMATSAGVADASALSLEERALAAREIAALARIFRMPIGLDVGYYDTTHRVPCSPLAGASANVDYRGRLTLCCNLSGFRGAAGEPDITGDLVREPFAVAHARQQQLAAAQVERRWTRLAALAAAETPADLATGSPCLFCLHTFAKTPWTAPAPIAEPSPA
jgi:MoaA/NifB/PqqE/SkfB family radical SAM enzyme